MTESFDRQLQKLERRLEKVERRLDIREGVRKLVAKRERLYNRWDKLRNHLSDEFLRVDQDKKGIYAEILHKMNELEEEDGVERS